MNVRLPAYSTSDVRAATLSEQMRRSGTMWLASTSRRTPVSAAALDEFYRGGSGQRAVLRRQTEVRCAIICGDVLEHVRKPEA